MWRCRGWWWHQESHQQGQICILPSETCLGTNSILQKNKTEVISKLGPLHSFIWLRMLAYNGTWPQIVFNLPHKMSSIHNENILSTNNIKQATVQNYRTRCYEQHLVTRRCRWIGHVLRKKDDSTLYIQNSTKMDTCWKKKTWTIHKNMEDSRKRTGTTTFELAPGFKVSVHKEVSK